MNQQLNQTQSRIALAIYLGCLAISIGLALHFGSKIDHVKECNKELLKLHEWKTYVAFKWNLKPGESVGILETRCPSGYPVSVGKIGQYPICMTHLKR